MNKKNNNNVGKEFAHKFKEADLLLHMGDTPVMLWLTDPKGHMVFTNTRWKGFIGRDRYQAHGGDAWTQALHPEDKERVIGEYDDAFRARAGFTMEYRLLHNDGIWREIVDTGEPYYLTGGSFGGYVGFSTDTTYRKHFEAQLKRSNAQLSRHNEEMRRINEMNRYLQASRSQSEAYQVIRHFAERIFPQVSGTLYLGKDGKPELESVAKWGNEANGHLPMLSQDDCWGHRHSNVHVVRQSSPGLYCPHVDPDVPSDHACIPIIAQSETVGILHLSGGALGKLVDDREESSHASTWRQIVSNAADNIGLAIVSLRLKEALEFQSVRDPLTGLYNRRHMEDSLKRELDRARRKGMPLGVAMMDLDHFKRLNDQYGHILGDQALRDAARIVTESLRSSDIACRFGGEEFLLIMPEASQSAVAARANEIRASLAGHEVSMGDQVYGGLTASFGVASTETCEHSSSALIRAADQALYEAKHAGRNRVVASISGKEVVVVPPAA